MSTPATRGMEWDEEGYRSECKDKRAYKTKGHALHGMRQYARFEPHAKTIKYKIYRCRFCTNYHWGRKRKVNFGNDASRYDRPIAVDRPPPQGV